MQPPRLLFRAAAVQELQAIPDLRKPHAIPRSYTKPPTDLGSSNGLMVGDTVPSHRRGAEHDRASARAHHDLGCRPQHSKGGQQVDVERLNELLWCGGVRCSGRVGESRLMFRVSINLCGAWCVCSKEAGLIKKQHLTTLL